MKDDMTKLENGAEGVAVRETVSGTFITSPETMEDMIAQDESGMMEVPDDSGKCGIIILMPWESPESMALEF